jgi:hypothetical protein
MVRSPVDQRFLGILKLQNDGTLETLAVGLADTETKQATLFLYELHLSTSPSATEGPPPRRTGVFCTISKLVQNHKPHKICFLSSPPDSAVPSPGSVAIARNPHDFGDEISVGCRLGVLVPQPGVDDLGHLLLVAHLAPALARQKHEGGELLPEKRIGNVSKIGTISG